MPNSSATAPRHRVPRSPAALALALALVLVLGLAALGGCARSADRVAAQLDAALRADDLAAVLPLLSERSRPLVESAWRLGGAANPFRLAPGAAAVEVAAVSEQSGRMVAAVRAGGVQREWVFVQEAGEWRLDVFETALRRPWGP